MRKTLVVLATVLIVLATLIPTSANGAKPPKFWNIYDGRDSRFGIDMQVSYLAIWHRGYYTVRFKGYEYLRKRLNVAAVYLDTRRQNRGPEYRVQWGLPKDRDGHAWKVVRRVDSFRSSGHKVACHRLKTTVNYRRDVVRFKIPRSCLARPSKVRWTGYTLDVTRYRKHVMRGYGDWLHNGRFISRFWVGRSMPTRQQVAAPTAGHRTGPLSWAR